MKEIKIVVSDEIYDEIESEVKSAKIITPDATVEKYVQELLELHLKTKKEVESFNSGMGDLFSKMGGDMDVKDMLSKFMQSMAGDINQTNNSSSNSEEKTPKNSDDIDPRTKYRS